VDEQIRLIGCSNFLTTPAHLFYLSQDFVPSGLVLAISMEPPDFPSVPLLGLQCLCLGLRHVGCLYSSLIDMGLLPISAPFVLICDTTLAIITNFITPL
jgi:hypothetical protein